MPAAAALKSYPGPCILVLNPWHSFCPDATEVFWQVSGHSVGTTEQPAASRETLLYVLHVLRSLCVGIHKLTPPCVNWLSPIQSLAVCIIKLYCFVLLRTDCHLVSAIWTNSFKTAKQLISSQSQLVLWGGRAHLLLCLGSMKCRQSLVLKVFIYLTVKIHEGFHVYAFGFRKSSEFGIL